MRKLALYLSILTLALFTGTLAQAQANTAPHEITIPFTYTPNSSFPICTATITTNCVSGFQITEFNNATPGTVNNIATVPATSATSYTYNQTPLPPPGTYTITIVANAVYNGGIWQSTPATTGVTVPNGPAAVVVLTVTIQ